MPAPQAGGNEPARPGRWAEQQHATRILSDPVRGDRTVSGMPVRVPRANLIRGSAGGDRGAASGGSGRPGAGPEAKAPATPVPQRSPEAARSLLRGFQRGADRAAQQAPAPGEGADH